VIEIVPGKAAVRAVVLVVPGRTANAARDGLGAKSVVRGWQDRS
jgi:hypothetical protein